MLRRRHREEGGFALVAAIVVLGIVLLLAAAGATMALTTTNTSTRDVRSKQALQAAQAGMDVAVFRMNALSLDLSNLLGLTSIASAASNPDGILGALGLQCVADTDVGLGLGALLGSGSGPDGARCPATHEDLGNGASFTYQVSPLVHVQLLSSGGTNSGLPLDVRLKRVIVASGTAGGVTRRIYAAVTGDGGANRLLDKSKVSCNMLNSGGLLGLVGGLLKCLLSPVTSIIDSIGLGNVLDGLLGDLGLGGVLPLLSSYTDLDLNNYEMAPGSFRECTPGDPSDPWSGAAQGCPGFSATLAAAP